MPAYTVPKTPLAVGAGYLFYGNPGSALPAYTVVGSVFTDDWSAVSGWFLLGVTKTGHEFEYAIETATIDAAEYFDPLSTVTTGRKVGMKFELQLITATGIKRMLNGGTLTTSGSGTTLRSTYKPPAPGTEVRCMIGWEATDNTERLVIEQAFQTGSLTINRKKGADNATLPVEFAAEIPSSGTPFQHDFAGTARG
jgi:hypothetical protein